MATNLTTITNISKQAVPILVNATTIANVQVGSDLAETRAEQTSIAPGAELNVESNRVSLAQLEQLRRLGLITFVAR
jgi:hypothetical protein